MSYIIRYGDLAVTFVTHFIVAIVAPLLMTVADATRQHLWPYTTDLHRQGLKVAAFRVEFIHPRPSPRMYCVHVRLIYII